MAAPVWITPPGDLGTISEGEFYQVQLTATDASTYKYLSGSLPGGIRITANGIIEGNPQNLNYIQGVPFEVSNDITSKFVVRATSADGTVADRVFEMTVTGQDAPQIDLSPSSDLGTYFDGDYVEVQLTVTDPDVNDNFTWSIQSGDLPSGLTISSLGKIKGYLDPIPSINGTPGFDRNSFDTKPFDFRTVGVDRFFEFVVQVSDGKDIDIKKYSLYVASRNLVTADIDIVSADSSKV